MVAEQDSSAHVTVKQFRCGNGQNFQQQYEGRLGELVDGNTSLFFEGEVIIDLVVDGEHGRLDVVVFLLVSIDNSVILSPSEGDGLDNLVTDVAVASSGLSVLAVDEILDATGVAVDELIVLFLGAGFGDFAVDCLAFTWQTAALTPAEAFLRVRVMRAE